MDVHLIINQFSPYRTIRLGYTHSRFMPVYILYALNNMEIAILSLLALIDNQLYQGLNMSC